MAVRADAGQHVSHRHTAWCVRILVAVETINVLSTVWLTVTGRTLRHDFRVIFLHRIVSVEHFVTLTAIKLVLTSSIL